MTQGQQAAQGTDEKKTLETTTYAVIWNASQPDLTGPDQLAPVNSSLASSRYALFRTFIKAKLETHNYLSPHIVGIPWICIGVGFSIFFRASAAMIALGNFISSKDRQGGGISSPSTRIRNFFLTFSCLPSPNLATHWGALQLRIRIVG